MDVVPIVFSVVLVVLAIVLSVVGIQMVLVLNQLRKTLERVNRTMEVAEEKMHSVVMPLQQLGGAAAGLKAGMHVFEAFVGWLNREKKV